MRISDWSSDVCSSDLDLYHRLRVIELHQPPLRERGGDIALIAAHALPHHAGEATRRIRGFAPCAQQAMQRSSWPGNVRELINRGRQAAVICEGPRITARLEERRVGTERVSTCQSRCRPFISKK